jgi:hypothetical protein
MVRSRRTMPVTLLAVFSLAAFYAIPAQAETGAKWLVLNAGKLLTDAEIDANKEKLEASAENGTFSLLSSIAKLELEIKCSTVSLIDALLAANGSLKKGMKIKLAECKLFKRASGTLTEEITNCKPHSPGSPLGTIESNSLHALLQLYKLANEKVDDVILILPDNEETNEFFHTEWSFNCIVGEIFSTFGKLALSDCSGEGRTHQVTHLLSEFEPLTKLYMAGEAEEREPNTRTDGSLIAKLASARQWAGTPN